MHQAPQTGGKGNETLREALLALSESERAALLHQVQGKRRVIVAKGSKTKLGLDLGQQRRLLEASANYFTPIPGEDPESIPGSTVGLTNEKVYGLIWLMMQGGLHRTVIANPSNTPPTSSPTGRPRGGGAYLTFTGVAVTWRRPKKWLAEGQSSVGIPEKDREWVKAFVLWLKERNGLNWMMVNRICWRLGKKIDHPVPLSPMTLRHTAGQNLARRGYSAIDIADMLNCTLAVARGYTHQAPEARVMEDEMRGRLKAPGEL
jgi:hypothetical protein